MARWDDALIVTDARIAVEECCLGPCAETETVRALGGEVDGLGLWASEPLEVSPGDAVLVFARRRGEVLRAVGGAPQGLFRLDEEVAVRALGPVIAPAEVVPERRLSLETLRRLVEDEPPRRETAVEEGHGLREP